MNSNPGRFSSSIIRLNLDEQTENQILEPLLPIDQDSQNSSDGIFVNKNRSSTCYFSFTKLESFFSLMSAQTSRPSCLGLLKWIPVIFILGLVGWSYYAYVVEMCILTIENIIKKVFYLIFYHVLLVLFVWSYLRTVLTKSLNPTEQFYLNESDGENVSTAQTIDERRAMLIRLSRQSNLPLLTRHYDGSVRYCFTCRCIKPDRAHHCSLCQKCSLRYDHHCPWTNSCISYGNYKYFVLFLGYAFTFCLYVALTSLEYFIRFWKGFTDSQDDTTNNLTSGKFQLLFLFFVSIMFAISVSSLFFYHLYLTSKNRTTIESFRAPIFATGPEKNGFNLGTKRNFQEIFGDRLLLALIPVPTSRGDGIHYPIIDQLIGRSYDEQQTLTQIKSVNVHSTSNQIEENINISTNRTSDFLVNLGPSADS